MFLLSTFTFLNCKMFEFLDEHIIEKLLQNNTKINIGILALDLIDPWKTDILSKSESEFRFYDTSSCSNLENCSEIKDKTNLIEDIKLNINNVLHVGSRYFSVLFGPHNFTQFSSPLSSKIIKKYSSLIDVEPISINDCDRKIKNQIKNLNGIVFTGGENDFFEIKSKFNKMVKEPQQIL